MQVTPPAMNEAKLGLPGLVARDAAIVLGVVMSLCALGAGAQAEPVNQTQNQSASGTSQGASSPTPVPVRVVFNDTPVSAPSSSQPASASAAPRAAPANDPDVQEQTRQSRARGGANEAAEVRCLAEAVYYEARGEPLRGQQAVAEVVANRVRSRAYPNTYCGVVYQRARNVCQFSWACDGRRSAPRGAAWTRAMDIAQDVHAGREAGVARGATHFHTTGVRPGWASRIPRVGQIGTHIFYRLR
ncbi:MAG: cell wall hydrolase [Hyphomonadaceae bacterium]|jgi:spore germination cell wall hydrolase CwlJ-like protein|nr:cell wall hydrolase [Hyphomonadaceae bacterium]